MFTLRDAPLVHSYVFKLCTLIEIIYSNIRVICKVRIKTIIEMLRLSIATSLNSVLKFLSIIQCTMDKAIGHLYMNLLLEQRTRLFYLLLSPLLSDI